MIPPLVLVENDMLSIELLIGKEALILLTMARADWNCGAAEV